MLALTINRRIISVDVTSDAWLNVLDDNSALICEPFKIRLKGKVIMQWLHICGKQHASVLDIDTSNGKICITSAHDSLTRTIY